MSRLCQECGYLLSDTDTVCPECGSKNNINVTSTEPAGKRSVSDTGMYGQQQFNPQPPVPQKKNSFILPVIIVAVVLLLGIAGGVGYFKFYLPYKNGGQMAVEEPEVAVDAPAVSVAPSTPAVQNAEASDSSNAITENSSETNKSYFATTKAFFYNEPNDSTIRKAYLGEGDVAVVTKIQNEFGYISFTNSQGQVTKGWVKMSDLQVNNSCGEWSIRPEEDEDGYGLPSITLKGDGTAQYNPSDDFVYIGKYIIINNNIRIIGKFSGDNAKGNEPEEQFSFTLNGNTLKMPSGQILIHKNDNGSGSDIEALTYPIIITASEDGNSVKFQLNKDHTAIASAIKNGVDLGSRKTTWTYGVEAPDIFHVANLYIRDGYIYSELNNALSKGGDRGKAISNELGWN